MEGIVKATEGGFLGELKRSILNGSVIGDEEGKWMYIEERGETVIDYCVAE